MGNGPYPEPRSRSTKIAQKIFFAQRAITFFLAACGPLLELGGNIIWEKYRSCLK
jgi:hypothetical protein